MQLAYHSRSDWKVVKRTLTKILHVYGLSVGVLACLDGYMNIAIEQTEEYVNGQLKNKYGDAFLRGNNGKIICLAPEAKCWSSWTEIHYIFLH